MSRESATRLTSAKKARITNSGDQRFLLLFLILLVDLLLNPFVGDQGVLHQWYRLIGLFVTFLCVYAVSFGRSTLIVAILLAIPVALHRAILPIGVSESTLAILGTVANLIFDSFIIVVIFRRIFRPHLVRSQTIFGALAIYLMGGFLFTRLYCLVVAFAPGAFYVDPAINGHTVATTSDLIFYSFVTMTSLGASSIVPKIEMAKSLTMIESIVGVLYLAALVSRLVAIYSSRDPDAAARNGEESIL